MKLEQWLTSGKWRGAKTYSVPQLDGTVEFSVSLCWKADDAQIEDEWSYSHGAGVTLEKAIDSAYSDPFTLPPRLADQPAAGRCPRCRGRGVCIGEAECAMCDGSGYRKADTAPQGAPPTVEIPASDIVGRYDTSDDFCSRCHMDPCDCPPSYAREVEKRS